MVNIDALMAALPVTGLEPQELATLCGMPVPDGSASDTCSFRLLEPPAGQKIAYLNIAEALEALLHGRRDHSLPVSDQVLALIADMHAKIPAERFIRFFDRDLSDTPEALNLPDFLDWLRQARLVDGAIIEFIAEVGSMVIDAPLFHTGYDSTLSWSLRGLPATAPERAMIEFTFAPVWIDHNINHVPFADPQFDNLHAVHSRYYEEMEQAFLAWREQMRVTAERLERQLGEKVYRFSDWDYDADDDEVHRFLILHWCCCWKPQSKFLQFLMQRCGAEDVDELKAALIDPASYQHPYRIIISVFGIDAYNNRIDFRQFTGAD